MSAKQRNTTVNSGASDTAGASAATTRAACGVLYPPRRNAEPMAGGPDASSRTVCVLRAKTMQTLSCAVATPTSDLANLPRRSTQLKPQSQTLDAFTTAYLTRPCRPAPTANTRDGASWYTTDMLW